MICVTSFHKDHWDLYASNFINAWIKYWPVDARLYVYHQECPVNNERVSNINLDLQTNFANFKNTALSLVKNETNKKIKNKYLKGLRWSHKVYSICDLLLKTDEPIIWLDADTVTRKNIPANYDNLLLEGYDLAVHVETQNKMEHWESGLFVIAGTVNQRQELVDNILSIYDSGIIWDKPKTWDGHIWPECCSHMKLNDLNKDIKSNNKGYFQNKNVYPYMSHIAGDKKFTNVRFNKRSGRINS